MIIIIAVFVDVFVGYSVGEISIKPAEKRILN